jgi:NAD(P)-dependent dehydrogenase (short-subunit alcohol dehydrogenase family)
LNEAILDIFECPFFNNYRENLAVRHQKTIADNFIRLLLPKQIIMANHITLPSLKGKRIIVAGGARGIGAAATRILANQGAHIFIFDVRDDLGKALAAELSKQLATPVSYLHVDVSKKGQVVEGVETAVRNLGSLDCLLNAAGIDLRSPCEHMSEAEIDFLLDVNLKGTIYMSQAVFPYMKDSGGNVLNLGSDAGLDPFPGVALYAASKGAVHSFTRAAAKEWGKYNIRVNALLPAVWTELFDEYRNRVSLEELEDFDKQMSERIFLGGKLGDPNRDLAPVIAFLMSDCSCFITSQLIPVNGGLGQVR